MGNEKRILALDVATRTGFAYGGPHDKPISGTFDVSRAGKNHGFVGKAYKRELSALITRAEPDLIYFEQPIMPKRSELVVCRKLYGLAFMTEFVALSMHNFRCNEGNISTVRAHFCAKGQRDKAGVMARCDQLGWPYEDDNAADALALWDWAIFKNHPDLQGELTVRQMEKKEIPA